MNQSNDTFSSMPQLMNPYDVLDISPSSTKEQIKKKYHKMALMYHPDKNKDPGAPEKFRKITEAYKTIMNENDADVINEFPELNELFKMIFGLGYLTQCLGRGGGGPLPYHSHGLISEGVNIITHVMKGDSSSAGPSINRVINNFLRPKGPSATTSLQLTLEQIFKGGTFQVFYNIKVPTGKMIEYNNEIMMMGGGSTRPLLIPEEKIKQISTKIEIPAGIDTEYPYILHEFIDYNSHRPENFNDQKFRVGNGDLIINIFTQEHPIFKRKGNHLKTKINITLKEALTGFSRIIKQIDGEQLEINSYNIIEPNTIKCIEGAGMYIHEDNEDNEINKFNNEVNKTIKELTKMSKMFEQKPRGNLYIKFVIQFPDSLTNDQKEKLIELL